VVHTTLTCAYTNADAVLMSSTAPPAERAALRDCKAEACAIQTCLAAKRAQESRCVAERAAWERCSTRARLKEEASPTLPHSNNTPASIE
jgi:hypothetical protein